MFKYFHHIGDFNQATIHLTRIERSIYRDMLDLYYETEQPLMSDTAKLQRRLRAVTTEEKQAVIDVLNEFFVETEAGYFNKRCNEEIEAYHANQGQKSEAGKASAEKRKIAKLQKLAELNGFSTVDEYLLHTKSTDVERSLNSVATECERNCSEQATEIKLTNNRKPITNNQYISIDSPSACVPEKTLNIPFEDFWDAYGKKINPEKCKAKWTKLKDAERESIMEHLKEYIPSTPDKTYRKNPFTYLNNKSWNDEVIKHDDSQPRASPVKPLNDHSQIRQKRAEYYRNLSPFAEGTA